MIALHDIAVEDWRIPSFELRPGERATFFSESEETQVQFLDTLLGLHAPDTGTVTVLDRDLYRQSERARLQVLARVGTVPEDGGLISNLPACENVLLPAAYHCGSTAGKCEPSIVAALHSIGLSDDEAMQLMVQVPDKLTLFEKRLVALLRLYVQEPLLCVYQSLFDDLDHTTAAQLAQLTDELQRRDRRRAALFTGREEEPLNEFCPGPRLTLERNPAHEIPPHH